MIALTAVILTLAAAMFLNARESHLSRKQCRDDTASILAAIGSPVQVESAADRNLAAFGSMSKEHVR